MSEPREFFVYMDESALIVRKEKSPFAVIEEIHVIEKSYYDELQAKLDKAASALEFMDRNPTLTEAGRMKLIDDVLAELKADKDQIKD